MLIQKRENLVNAIKRSTHKQFFLKGVVEDNYEEQRYNANETLRK